MTKQELIEEYKSLNQWEKRAIGPMTVTYISVQKQGIMRAMRQLGMTTEQILSEVRAVEQVA
jgi:hypothetical protein